MILDHYINRLRRRKTEQSILQTIDSTAVLVHKKKLLRIHQEHFTKLSRLYCELPKVDRQGAFGKELYAEMKSLNEKILA